MNLRHASFAQRWAAIRRREATCTLLFAVSGLAVIPLAAAQTTQPESVQDPLAVRQQLVRDRMAQLEDRMYRLSQKLAQTEPQQAKRIEAAIQELGRQLVRHHMEEAIQRLDEADLAGAAQQQDAAQQALEEVLKLLLDNAPDQKERQDEIERLRQFAEAVDKLIDRQQDLHTQADPLAGLPEPLKSAARALHHLIERQQTQIDETQQLATKYPNDASAASQPATSQPGPSPVDLGGLQRDIRRETETLARALQQVASQTQPAGNADKPADTEALERVQSRIADAARQMQSAEKQLFRADPATALPEEQAALEALQHALDAAKGATPAEPKMAGKDASEQQQQIEQEAARLAEQMQGGDAENAPPASSPDSQPAADATPSAQPQAAGAQGVQQARRHMRQSAQQLDRNQPVPAGAEQEQAIEQLEQARQALQESLDQLRREQQAEMLTGLEQRFREILAGQKRINAGTIALAAKPAESWARGDALALAGLADEQTQLSDKIDAALRILTEEGTTLIFPQVVEQVRDDMREASRRLGQKQIGDITRNIQAEIVTTLEELLDAVKQQQQQLAQGGNSGGGGGGGSPEQNNPLLPGSAELKLLKACQLRINRQTQTLHEAAVGGSTTPDTQQELHRVAERQRGLSDLARKMNERATGQ